MGVGVGGRGKVRGVFGGPLLVRVGRHAFGWLVGLGFCWMGLGGVCGWMDGYFLLFSTFSFSATSQSLSLSLCQSYEISQRRAYRPARSCKGRYSRRTHTHTHACIHIKRKNHPQINKQTHITDKSPVLRYLLPLYRAAVCLFVCALPYSTLPLHIIVTLISLCYAAKPLPVPNPNKDHWSKAQDLIHPTDFLPDLAGKYIPYFLFSVGRVQTDGEKRKERKGKGREGGFHERENKNGYG